MSKKPKLSAEDELKQLALATRRMFQLQDHAKKAHKHDRPAAEAAARRSEAEVRRLVTATLDYRTSDIPWEQPAEEASSS